MRALSDPQEDDRMDFLNRSLIAVFVTFAATIAHAQAGSFVPDAPADHRDLPPMPTAGATPSNAPLYAFPDWKQQLHNYLDSTFGPVALVRSAIGAGIDQGKPAPPEWDAGAEGFGERYGFRLGMGVIAETTKYSAGALLREDVAYHKCSCSAFVARTAHALVSPFTARMRTGRTVLSLPSIGAPYAGSFAAVSAWYPARYEPEDAARLGTFSFTLSMGANLVREFVLPSR